MWIDWRNSFLRRLVTGSLLVSIGVAVASCGVTGSKKNKLEQALDPGIDTTQPTSPEARIGAKEHPGIIAANGGIYVNPKLKESVAEIVKTLITHSDNPNKRYRVTILNTPTVNAFALPGGYLYVTRGLLALANNSAEVAAVLAHEMAHVTASHGIERSKKLQSAKLADRVVLDVLTNDRAGKIALAASKINLAKFSQNQELQADSLGIKMLGKAGYDAFAAAHFLEAMARNVRYQSSRSSNSDEQDFLATHPSTPRRIELAKRHARIFGAPGSGIRNHNGYLAGINGILFGDSAQEGYVRQNRFSHAGLGITFKVPRGFDIENSADAVVISGPNQIAVRFDGVAQPRGVSLMSYMQSGWVNGLNRESITSATINSLKAAYGEAASDGWIFHISLIRSGSRVYRFILAAPKAAGGANQTARRISGTFRKLTRREKRVLKPLKIKVVRVGTNDTIASLAGSMHGDSGRLGLFRLLNGIKSGERLKKGQLVKIVVSD